MMRYHLFYLFIFFKFFFQRFIYFWDRERQSMNGGGAEREGDTEPEAGSRLWAVSTEPDAGLELLDHKIMSWAEIRRLTKWATQSPSSSFKKAVYLETWDSYSAMVSWHTWLVPSFLQTCASPSQCKKEGRRKNSYSSFPGNFLIWFPWQYPLSMPPHFLFYISETC